MAQSLAVGTENGRAVHRTADEQGFEVLRELTRHGYVPDTSDIEASGILLRHDSAPDLLLHADGRIEVPLGQPAKSRRARLVPDVRRGMSWRRTLFIAILVAAVWFFSAFLTASFLEM